MMLRYKTILICALLMTLSFLLQTCPCAFGADLSYQWVIQWHGEYGGYGHAQFAQPIGDLDHDRINEFVVGGYELQGRCRIMSYDAATGTYKEEYSWTHGGGTYNSPSGATILDLDGDGTLELVVSWAYSGSNDGVWAYKWDGKTLTPLDHWYGGFVFDVYSADIDGDGIKDVLVANAPWGAIYAQVVVLGWQNGHFVVKSSWIHPSYTYYECMMLWTGDVNCDGKVDIVVSLAYSSSYNGGTWGLNWDPATNTWTYWPIYTALINGAPHYGVVVGDVNGNGIPEIAIGNNPPRYTGAGAVLVEWDPTTGTYKKVWEGTWPSEYGIIEAVAIGDADNDGNNEFVAGGGYVHIIGWDGIRYYEKAILTQTRGLLSGIVIGDFDSDGKNELKACDIGGYGPGWEWIFEYEVYDVNPPITTHNYDFSWRNKNFIITLSATDDVSGVRETYYIVNGDGVIRRVSVDGQPYITTEGENNTLEFWSVDKAGNVEPHKFIYGIKLDKTPPHGWIIINDNKTFTNTSAVIIKFNYSDGLSGVVGIRFSNDGSWNNQTWEKPQLLEMNWNLTSGEGERTVYMQMIDKAGNIYTANDSIIVDSTPPRTTADYDKKWHNKDFYINLTSSDNFSTSPEIYYRIDNGPIKNVRADGQPYITNESANNTLEYWSVDEAGNEETHHHLYGIKLDKTSPVADFDLPVKVEAGSQVKFDALKKSYDICSGISRCIWIFGDGTTSEEFIITHVYADTGKYNVTLTIIDMAGNVATCVKTVEVVPKPQLNFWLIIGLSGVITLAVISVVMAKNRSERKVKKEIRGKPPETYTSPAPPHEPVVTKEVKPVKVFRSREEELDDMVLDYIEAHGGTISLSRAAEDLGITYEELISSIDRLKNAGKLRQE